MGKFKTYYKNEAIGDLGQVGSLTKETIVDNIKKLKDKLSQIKDKTSETAKKIKEQIKRWQDRAKDKEEEEEK